MVAGVGVATRHGDTTVGIEVDVAEVRKKSVDAVVRVDDFGILPVVGVETLRVARPTNESWV